MLAVSCKKDNEQKINNAGNGFRATVETQAGDSKTHLEGYVLKWDGDEEILVSSSTSGAKKFSVNKLEGGTAIFEAAETLPEDFYTPDYTAYYPASVLSGDFSFLAEQDYAANSFAAGANPMVAVSGKEALDFRNICGVLELNFTGADITVETITITSDNDVLSGTGTLDLTNPDAPALTLTGDGHSITLDCGEGVALNPITATAFRIVAPVGAFESGFTVAVTDKNGKVWTKTTEKDNSIERSKITTLGEISLTPYYSVSATKKVLFAKGNLQYIGSTATWKFADNQYDYFGDNGQNGGDQDINRDLFGWGTNGHNNGNHYYQPWNYKTNKYGESVGYGYGPVANNYKSNLEGETDWGAVFNPNAEGKTWRTLTKDEWNYLFNNDNRKSSDGKLLRGLGCIDDKNGLFILPDNWKEMIAFVGIADDFNYGSADFSGNVVSVDKWAKMEEAGATFLPAAGYRHTTDEGSTILVEKVNASVDYWTSSFYSKGRAYSIDSNSQLANHKRSKGFAVRLAYDLN